MRPGLAHLVNRVVLGFLSLSLSLSPSSPSSLMSLFCLSHFLFPLLSPPVSQFCCDRLHEFLFFHFDLSWANLLDMLYFFSSVVTTFSHVLFGPSLPLGGPSTCIIFFSSLTSMLAYIGYVQTTSNEFFLFYHLFMWTSNALENACSWFYVSYLYHTFISIFSSLLHSFYNKPYKKKKKKPTCLGLPDLWLFVT